MLTIIPNWHPVFVHFTVALLSLAVGLFIVTPFLKPPLQEQWRIVARWALWFGAGFTVITGLTGLYAYNTVAHDTPSHAAMTDHRNWATATITLFFVITVWSAVRVRRQQALDAVFIAVMVIAGGVLASTAWRGGEVVYRYGLGVMSLPKAEGKGHAHEHTNGGGHGHASETPAVSSEIEVPAVHHEQDGDHHTDRARAHDDMDMTNSSATAEQVDIHNTNHAHSDPAMQDREAVNGKVPAKSMDHHDDGHDHTH